MNYKEARELIQALDKMGNYTYKSDSVTFDCIYNTQQIDPLKKSIEKLEKDIFEKYSISEPIESAKDDTPKKHIPSRNEDAYFEEVNKLNEKKVTYNIDNLNKFKLSELIIVKHETENGQVKSKEFALVANITKGLMPILIIDNRNEKK